MGKRNYFSADNQEKFCSACTTKVKLKKFRVVQKARELDESSRYCSICKDCENTRAKSYQKLHYKPARNNMKKTPTKRQGGMNKAKFLEDLAYSLYCDEDVLVLTRAESLKVAKAALKHIEKAGMVPVSKYCGFSMMCTINDWEENITDDQISREMDRQTDRD